MLHHHETVERVQAPADPESSPGASAAPFGRHMLHHHETAERVGASDAAEPSSSGGAASAPFGAQMLHHGTEQRQAGHAAHTRIGALPADGAAGASDHRHHHRHHPHHAHGKDAPPHNKVQALARQPSVTGAKEMEAAFHQFDVDGDGKIDLAQLLAAVHHLKLPVGSEHRVQSLMEEADADDDGLLTFGEFAHTVEMLKASTGDVEAYVDGMEMVEYVVADKAEHVLRRKEGDTVHSFAQEECAALVDFLNAKLANDETVDYLLPMVELADFFEGFSDGVLLCKLINLVQDETVDERVLNYRPANRFLIMENLNLALNAAKSIGVKVVNIGPTDILDGRPHLVLGLVWQLVKAALMANINLKDNPNLVRLLTADEAPEDLRKLRPEKLLLRWVNYHLREAGVSARLDNFGGAALADSSLYLHLLSRIDADGQASASLLETTADPLARAEAVVAHAHRIGAEFRVQPADIVAGNDKLNLALLAALFNAAPGLLPPDTQQEAALLAEVPDDDADGAGDSREERAFRMWINSLGLADGATADGTGHCHNLYDDVADGTLLLHVMEAVRPGVVEWGRVNKPPIKMVFKRIENLNYAVDLALKTFRFSLVGVQGKDLADGNRKLTLALIWQLMRSHLVAFLASMRSTRGGDHAATDGEMVTWANERVAASGRPTTMRDFADKSLGTSLFLIDLLAAVEPRAINRSMVTPGETEEERRLNAKYAISSARKLGCSLFVVWEDLVDVRPKMVLSFVATVMSFTMSAGAEQAS